MARTRGKGQKLKDRKFHQEKMICSEDEVTIASEPENPETGASASP